MHFEEGSLLAVVKDVIVNPDTGKLEAVWVKPAAHILSYAVIRAEDIVEWKKHLYIKSEQAIADPADIIKIAEILTDGRQIIGNEVRTEEGVVLGRVTDIDFDTRDYYLHHLHVEKRWLGMIRRDRRILSYDLIVQVFKDYILVKDKNAAKETVGSRLTVTGEKPVPMGG